MGVGGIAISNYSIPYKLFVAHTTKLKKIIKKYNKACRTNLVQTLQFLSTAKWRDRYVKNCKARRERESEREREKKRQSCEVSVINTFFSGISLRSIS